VQYQGVNSNVATLSLVPAAPALFLRGYFASTGSYQAAALNQDGTPNSTANPATRGSYISLFGTGGGATNPAGITGGLSPFLPLALIAPPVTATVNGAIAEVQYAGAAPTLSSGLFQLNIKIPAGLPNGQIGPAVVIEFTIGGVVGSSVTIAVQ
jgi:uncharacterized protein (TIGR03437 family)